MPKASVATRRSVVITSCEKYGGIALSRALTCPWESLPCAGLAVRPLSVCPLNRSGREKAGHSRAWPQPLPAR